MPSNTWACKGPAEMNNKRKRKRLDKLKVKSKIGKSKN
jgi:hypothetical protein